MDQSDFDQNSPGQILANEEGDPCFHPDPLPPDLEFPPELAKNLAEARGAVSELAGLRSSGKIENPHMLIYPYIRVEALLSSKIEGTQATLSDIYAVEQGHQIDEGKRDDTREVLNHIRALQEGLAAIDGGKDINVELICNLHETLLANVRGEEKNPGNFREIPVKVRGGKYVPPPPSEVKYQLEQLIEFVQDSPENLPALIEIALVHYQFETIHPFRDGNGRMGRVLITLMLLERGILPDPYLYASAPFVREKEKYMNAMYEVSSKNEWGNWLEFFLTGLKEQAEKNLERSQDLAALREEYIQKYQGGGAKFDLALKLFEIPIITVNKANEILSGKSKQTAYNAIDDLEKDGVLEEIPNDKRYNQYVATRIFDILQKSVVDDTEEQSHLAEFTAN